MPDRISSFIFVFGVIELKIINNKQKKRHPLNISQLISVIFFAIIVLGTLLLCLPVSSRNGSGCGLMKALFTATSATCVTGLVLADTWTQWSGFGQTVILGLIEIGGLGFMSAASLVIFSLKKKINMSQQMVIAQSIGSESLEGTTRIQKNIIRGCLAVEAAGAAVLTLRFLPEYGIKKALKLGIFHSVSAFCNAGFDILGFDTPNGSLIKYGTDPTVCFTLSFLIITGGIGFIVWDEIFRNPSPKKWSVYTKLVLITTASLLISGTAFFLLTEWNNPLTIGKFPVWQKIIAAFFQSATTRTAGFAGMDQGALTDGGKALTIFYMLIGGSSGSTAGGLKTVTFIVLVLFISSRMRGKERVDVFHRTIPDRYVLNSVTLFGIMIILAFAGGTLICSTSGVSFTDGLYESVSALATVGLTTGITPALSLPAKLLMIIYMYFGRVGILTVSIGFLREKHSDYSIRYAETNLLIG